jgi:hypothetical protein
LKARGFGNVLEKCAAARLNAAGRGAMRLELRRDGTRSQPFCSTAKTPPCPRLAGRFPFGLPPQIIAAIATPVRPNTFHSDHRRIAP